MTDFYIRKFEYLPDLNYFTGIIQKPEYEEYTNLPMFSQSVLPSRPGVAYTVAAGSGQTSLFDVTYLKELYILPAFDQVYGYHDLNNPRSPFIYRVKQITDDYSTDTFSRFIDGEFGNSNRKIRLSQEVGGVNLITAFKDKVFEGLESSFQTANYDTSTESNFLNDVCSQINQSISLYQPLTLYNKFNIIFYKRRYVSISGSYYNSYTILYYPGADPNADQVISI